MKGSRFIYVFSIIAIMFAFGCGQEGRTDRSQDDLFGQSDDGTMERVQEFTTEALSAGMMEIRLSEIAMERSDHAEVDQLAQTVKSDFEQANSELKQIASSKNWGLAATLMDKHQRMIEDLQETDADKVDEEYLETVVDAHEDAIRRFEKFAEMQEDMEVNAWVRNTLPVLRRHLSSATALKDRTAAKVE